MKKVKLLRQQAAFTLIELIIIVIILAILASTVQTRFISSNDFKQDTIIAQIISAARLAQQLSMNDSSRSFSLVIQADQIDLQVDGNSIDLNTLDFPINFGNQIVLSPVSIINFDSLGRTSNHIINVQANNIQQVCFEETGYIHLC